MLIMYMGQIWYGWDGKKFYHGALGGMGAVAGDGMGMVLVSESWVMMTGW